MGDIPISDEIVMTREGYEKIKAELILHRSEGRPEIARMLEEARGFGDLSENAEYHSAKEAQGKLETRIQWLEYQLSKAKVVNPGDIDPTRVGLGTTVTLLDLDGNNQLSYTIVGSEESDPAANKISSSSPVGQAIIGKGIGEELAVRVPKGTRKFRIKDISVLPPR
ncbi:MAG: transcription elongation factor GreA [Thermovirgaceae bacterium]|nr:transcription elongation factor GreA [Thermovirgaceae bacterium]